MEPNGCTENDDFLWKMANFGHFCWTNEYFFNCDENHNERPLCEKFFENLDKKHTGKNPRFRSFCHQNLDAPLKYSSDYLRNILRTKLAHEKN